MPFLDPATKENWLDVVMNLRSQFPIEEVRYKLKSPIFCIGQWDVGIEHLRKFRSVVLRWRGPSDELPARASSWRQCSPSDCRKGWSYRVMIPPSALSHLLNELSPCLPALSDIEASLELAVAKAMKDTTRSRLQRLMTADPFPTKVTSIVESYARNADVIAEARIRARGICECCKKQAPFLRRTDASPYLEVHHRLPLAKGGKDTIENAEALCPNCHRKKHYA